MMKRNGDLINQVWAQYPSFFNGLHERITAERGFELFKPLADTYAPSLTAADTRGAVTRELIDDAAMGPHLTFHNNFRRSGNVALELGSSAAKPIWCMAHLDFISFLTAEKKGRRYRLISYCEPRQTPGMRKAIAHDVDEGSGKLVEVARGMLVTDDEGDFWFETDDQSLPYLTRVSYLTEARWDRSSGQVYGAIDDAFGCAALLLAAEVLSDYPVEALFLLTDEEEGVVDIGNQAFSRGSFRILQILQRTPYEQLPDMVVVTDVHASTDESLGVDTDAVVGGQGAVFTGVASRARGAVTPPRLLSFQRELARYLRTEKISLYEEIGYVSRSDCVSAMMFTPNGLRLGFVGAYSHFERTPRAHINDLVDLAKSIVVWVLMAQSKAWRLQYLGRGD